MLILRSMPPEVEQYLRFHSGETVQDLRKSIEYYHSRSRLSGDMSKFYGLGDKGKGKEGKGREKGKEQKGKGKGDHKEGKNAKGSGKDGGL